MSQVEKENELQKTLAKIESRKASFARSPFWFTVWDISWNLLNVVFWLGFWFLVANCECKGCML